MKLNTWKSRVTMMCVLAVAGSRSALATLDSQYSDPNRDFGYATSEYGSTVDLDSNFSTNIGDVEYVDTYYSYVPGSNDIYVSEYFNGVLGNPANDTPNQSQFTTITINGNTIYESVGTSSYDANADGGIGKGVVVADAASPLAETPDWWAQGNADLSFNIPAGVTLSAYGNYSEDPGFDTDETLMNFSVSWDLDFSTPALATTEAQDLGGAIPEIAVPEPASFILGATGVAFLPSFIRRRKR